MRRAFTLFEVLVVLVIMGLISTVTMSMISQLGHNIARVFPAAGHFMQLEVRLNFLNRTLSSFVPSREETGVFKGAQDALTGLATYFPGDAWPHERAIRVSIATDERGTVVKAEQLDAAGRPLSNDQAAVSFEIVRLSCGSARFFYLDGSMTWVDRWEQQGRHPYLPLAIRFACEEGRDALQTIAAIEREGHAIINDRDLLRR